MDLQDQPENSNTEDGESNELQILPAGEGDVKSCQTCDDTEINENLDSKDKLSSCTNSQLTKRSLFSRFLGTRVSHDTEFPKGAISNFATEDAYKYKTNSLGKIFRIKSAPSARHNNFDQTMVTETFSRRSREQSFKKSFGSLFTAFWGSKTHSNPLSWNETSNAEKRDGSLGKFFRYGHGRKGKLENQDSKGNKSILKELESESEFVTLPLDTPFDDEAEYDKSSSHNEDQLSPNSSRMIKSASSQRINGDQ
jgi:hypothetical protein